MEKFKAEIQQGIRTKEDMERFSIVSRLAEIKQFKEWLKKEENFYILEKLKLEKCTYKTKINILNAAVEWLDHEKLFIMILINEAGFYTQIQRGWNPDNIIKPIQMCGTETREEALEICISDILYRSYEVLYGMGL